MNAAASSFVGTVLPTQSRVSRAGRSSVTVNANTKYQRDIVKRGYNSEVRKAGKLLPKNPKKMEEKPERARKMFNARNAPRQGGFGSGGPWQPVSKKIPGAAGTRPLPNVDPLLYVGGLVAVFLALTLPTILSST